MLYCAHFETTMMLSAYEGKHYFKTGNALDDLRLCQEHFGEEMKVAS